MSQLRSFVASAREFVSKVYVPDLLAIASFYKDWAAHGRGVGSYLVFGEYPQDASRNAPLFLPQGIIRNRDLSKVEPFDQAKVAEYVTHSWYTYRQGNDASLHPSKGETSPNYTGPNPPYEYLNTDERINDVNNYPEKLDGTIYVLTLRTGLI